MKQATGEDKQVDVDFGILRRFSLASSLDFIAAGALGLRAGASDGRCSQQSDKTVSEKERT